MKKWQRYILREAGKKTLDTVISRMEQKEIFINLFCSGVIVDLKKVLEKIRKAI